MNIDISRLNLTEKDIEDWLYENPSNVTTVWGCVTEWVGRQYHLPSGIADLIGVTDCGMVALIEVKNVPINKAALTQICRYAADLLEIFQWRYDYPNPEMRGWSHVTKIVVGPSIDDQTLTEAGALDIDIREFTLSLDIDLNEVSFAPEVRDSLSTEYREIAHRPEWNRFGGHIDDLDRQYREERIKESQLDFAIEDLDAEHF